MIYFDNSATTRVEESVAQRAADLMCKQFGNPSSQHYLGACAYSELGVARNQISKMLGVSASRIYFTSGGTQSNNLAIQGGVRANSKVGRHIVTTAIEHSSVLETCAHLETHGYEVTYVHPRQDTACMNAQDIIDAVRADTALVSVMFTNNETGENLPLRDIITGVREKNPDTYIHCDCVQAFGKIPVKLHEYDLDMVSASAHKIHGPKGVGMLYLRNKDMVLPLEFGGSQEGHIRPGTENLPLACAFGLASDLALYQLQENLERATLLKERLVKRLQSAIPQILINSPPRSLPYVLNVSLPGMVADDLVSYMSLRDIYISTGSACSKGAKSYVLKAMGFSDSRIAGAVRISISKYTTDSEIDCFVDVFSEYVSTPGKIRTV